MGKGGEALKVGKAEIKNQRHRTNTKMRDEGKKGAHVQIIN